MLAGGIHCLLLLAPVHHQVQSLIGLRIDTLREMESRPEMAGSVQMYHVEDKIYPRDEQGKMIPGQGLNFSDLERRLPMVFLGLYVLYGMAALLALGAMAVIALARSIGLM